MRRPEVLALIPARGGSKSIPRKNLLPLNGRPLIAYSIDHALASTHITRTIVSTDDPEIAAVARAHGAEVPFMRPTAIAQDLSTDLETFQHALASLGEQGYACDCIVHLRPTGPVREVAVVDRAIALLLADQDADSLRSVSPPHQTPYKMWGRRGRYIEPLLSMEGVMEAHSGPRQQLPEVFWQNGYVDVIRARTIARGQMAGGRVLPFVVDGPIYELDYPEQIPVVEAALTRRDMSHCGVASGRRFPV